MKKFFLPLLLLLLPVLLSGQVLTNGYAQTPVAKGTLYNFQVRVDSLGTYTTSPFSLGGLDKESFVTYPVHYAKTITGPYKPRVSCVVQGAMSTTTGYTAVDTVALADSTKTLATGTLDLNDKKFPFYRLYIYGATGNRKDTTSLYSIDLYIPKVE